MIRQGLCLVALVLAAIPPAAADEDRAPWRRLFDRTAANYRLTRPAGSGPAPLKLVEGATYTWARSGPHDGNYGNVYVWTHQGNVEAVACFWRWVDSDGRPAVVHELHSLSPAKLESLGDAARDWKPKGPVERHPLEGAPVPAESAVGRMSQMRALCRDLAARSEGAAGDRTELRLLPQPLYRYQSTNPDVLDGALFAFVCSVGTDPELFLQLEALRTPEGPRWHYTLTRFSHMSLFVKYRDQPLWQAVRDAENPISHNADHTYWVFHAPFDPASLRSE